jgi:hypothetical protein
MANLARAATPGATDEATGARKLSAASVPTAVPAQSWLEAQVMPATKAELLRVRQAEG